MSQTDLCDVVSDSTLSIHTDVTELKTVVKQVTRITQIHLNVSVCMPVECNYRRLIYISPKS